jgi:6-pyruvoyltetrahydropterin/6-carboxytetrahydropterin synthase
MMKHSIRFESDSLYFSASHFITFGSPEKVEALHGHNFRIKAEIEGPMNRRSYIVDFVLAYDILKRICETLSHKVLLPSGHPYIKLNEEGGNIHVSLPPLSWTFPKDDTLVLPMKNATTEALAEYILSAFRQMLEDGQAFEQVPNQYTITVALEESPGMWAVVKE